MKYILVLTKKHGGNVQKGMIMNGRLGFIIEQTMVQLVQFAVAEQWFLGCDNHWNEKVL
jgi:hypothetical protein